MSRLEDDVHFIPKDGAQRQAASQSNQDKELKKILMDMELKYFSSEYDDQATEAIRWPARDALLAWRDKAIRQAEIRARLAENDEWHQIAAARKTPVITEKELAWRNRDLEQQLSPIEEKK